MNKEKVEQTLFALALHMKQCGTCLQALLSTPQGTGDLPCTEYRRLKAVAKAYAK